MAASGIPLAKELDRVPSMTVPLDAQQEQRFQRLMDEAIMIDVHQHPFICPEDMTRLVELLRGNQYKWGYEALKYGGWTALTTGTDTNIGDHVAFHRVMLGRDPEQLPAPYLDGLESPADGKNIIRGLIRRGYTDDEVKKLAGGNALQFFRRVMRQTVEILAHRS